MRRRPDNNQPEYSILIDQDGYPIEEEPEDLPEAQQERKKTGRFVRKLLLRLCIVGIILLMIEFAILLYSGQIWFNEPKKKDYPVRGPVMDDKGGEIYWSKFSKLNIQMCYLRATKSTSYVDESFEKNKEGAFHSRIPVGAIHIFDIRSDGKAQAENFLSAVGDMDGWLVPAVEVSPGLFDRLFAPDVNKVGTNLRDFVNTVKEKTGVCPVIKCSSGAYDKYIKGEFSDCMLWYESLYSEPDDSIDWTFWEYTSRTKLSSYEHDSHRLHMSVYRYGEDEFGKLIVNRKDTL